MSSQEAILLNVRAVAQKLDVLHDEHTVIKNKLLGEIDVMKPANDEQELIEEKASIMDKNLENIRLGIEEVEVFLCKNFIQFKFIMNTCLQMMMNLASYLEKSEADKQKDKSNEDMEQKYAAQMRMLFEENELIQEELSSTQEQLQTALRV
jgi:hypothetical protein